MSFNLLSIILIAMVTPLAEASHCLWVLGIRCDVLSSLVTWFTVELTFVCSFVLQVLVWNLVGILTGLIA